MTDTAAVPAPPPAGWVTRAAHRIEALAAQLPRSVYAVPLAVLAGLAVLVINETSYLRSSNALARLEQRAEAATRIQFVLRRMLDAQTGERGYLLTGRKSYLAPHEKAAEEALAELDWLRAYYAADASALALLKDLRLHAREKAREVAEAIAAYDAGDQERALSLLEAEGGQRHMSAVRRLANQLLEHERALVASDRKAVFETLRISRIGVNATAAFVVLALLLVLRQTAALDAIQRSHAQALQAEGEHLEAEVRRRTADLTQLARHLQTVREDEAHRLAHVLHEELGALLTTAKLDLKRLRHALGAMPPELAARIDHLDAGIDSGIALKRRIIEDLRPSSLANLGLVAALEIQLRDFGERTGVHVDHALQPLPLDDAVQITAYRLVQEALTNIAKYAQASRVSVTLQADGQDVSTARLTVVDDGRGFDPATTRRNAHGLMGMRYRVEAVGGHLTVDAAPGRGTRIDAVLPAGAPAVAGVET